MRRYLLPGLIALAAVLAAGTAHAENVGIVVTGEATLQPQLTAQLERWLHDRGRMLVPGALEPDAINTMIDCFALEDLACARGVVDARAQSRSLVYARVTQSANQDGTRDVTVTAFWFQKGLDALSERRVCNQCTDAKLLATVDELMLALVHEPPPPAAGTSRPPDANAATPQPPAPAPETEERAGTQRLVGYGLMGAGGLALIGGIVMIAIDEDPDPVGVQRPTYRDTATVGTVIGALGAAALGVGLYMLLTDEPRSQPVAAVSRDGAVFGWAGRF